MNKALPDEKAQALFIGHAPSSYCNNRSLTLIAKDQGGIGMQIGIGLVLTIQLYLFMQFLAILAQGRPEPCLIAMWIRISFTLHCRRGLLNAPNSTLCQFVHICFFT